MGPDSFDPSARPISGLARQAGTITRASWRPTQPRRLVTAAAVVVVVASVAVSVAGCGSAPPGRVAEWRQDIAYLSRQLPLVHVDGLTGVSRTAWVAAAERLEAQVPRLSNGQVLLGIMRIVALLHDNETSVNFRPGPVYPLALQWVGSRLYLVAVPCCSRRLLGARLVAIDGHPLGQILAQMRPEIDYRDPGVLAAAEANTLIEANMLAWLGVTSQARWAEFTVRTAAGTTMVRLTAGRADTLPWAVRALRAISGQSAPGYFPRERWLLAAYGSANLEHTPLPLYEQNLMAPYWMKVLPGGAVYLKYNACIDTDGFQQLAARAIALLRSHPGYWLITDLRNNPGGDTRPFQALISGIRADPAINLRGRIFGLINQFTDSSATYDAYSLRHFTNAILIGQPTEDPIDKYGNDGNVLTLPHGQISVRYTTKVVNPTKNELGIPAIAVAPTLGQILSGRDPVLQRALAYHLDGH